jgi:hypothetical protein
MSGQNWSVVIAPSATPGGPASFTPDLMGVRTGDPLQAGNADIISWNNRTPDLHQPVAVGSNGQRLSEQDARMQGLYLSDPIGPDRSSRPGYVTTALTTGVLTINYTCAFHPNERGTIRVFNT